jgi:hypothetical protein
MGTVQFRFTRRITALMSQSPNWIINFSTLYVNKVSFPKYVHTTGRHSCIPTALNFSQYKCSRLLPWTWHSFLRHVVTVSRFFLWNWGQCKQKWLYSKTEHIRAEFLWRLTNQNHLHNCGFSSSLEHGMLWAQEASLPTIFVIWLWSVFCLYVRYGTF